MSAKKRSYDPLNNYGGGETQQVDNVTPVLPRRVIGSPNFWEIAAELDGTKDATYTHTMTSAEISSSNFTIAFPHKLSFVPSVAGSFFVTSDAKKRDMPFLFFGDGNNYFGVPPSAYIGVDTIDTTNITVRVVIFDLAGLSFLAANDDLVFKFYCFQDAIV